MAEVLFRVIRKSTDSYMAGYFKNKNNRKKRKKISQWTGRDLYEGKKKLWKTQGDSYMDAGRRCCGHLSLCPAISLKKGRLLKKKKNG